MKLRKIPIVLCAIVTLLLAGCNSNSIDHNETSIAATSHEETTEELETSNDDMIEAVQDNYIWTKIDTKVLLTGGGSHGTNESVWHYKPILVLDPLCENQDIKSIEYYLENAKGTFMDSNKDDPYADNVISTPYLLEGNNQEGIYFSLCYTFDVDATTQQVVRQVSRILENVRIRLTITYNDGSVKVRHIGIKPATKYNYTNLDLYELTLPD